MWRVTDKPKKLKPLKIVSSELVNSLRENAPNGKHDEHTANGNGSVMEDLVESLPCIEIPSSAGFSVSYCSVQYAHRDECDEKTKHALPSNDLDGLECVLFHDALFDDKLRSGEDLSSSNK